MTNRPSSRHSSGKGRAADTRSFRSTPVADKYRNFAALEKHERAGSDYDVLVRRAQDRFAIVAPHGGGIEPGTSELADGVAGLEHSFYTFEGLKTSGNGDLHITATR